MTIWILVVLLLASLAGLGYRQGAIRVAFSLVGIFVAALLALPLSPLVKPVLKIFGVQSLIWAWALPPVIVFIIINGLFKGGAAPVHRKVDMHFKYKAGDLRLALFERLNARLGLCLGLLNGTAYLVLILMAIYIVGYPTVQLATSEEDPWTVRLFNRVARDLESTGLARVAKAVDPMPDYYYDAIDLAGLLYQNPSAEARLVRYPTLFKLGERTEFQSLAKDTSFTELRRRQGTPFRELMANPNAAGIIQNPDLLKEVWATVQPDIQDLSGYLLTGTTTKYGSEPILGQWSFDFNSAFNAFRRANPKLSALQIKEMRRALSGQFLNTTMTAGTDGFLVVRGLPSLDTPKPGEQAQPGQTSTQTGTWKSGGGKYEFNLEHNGQSAAFVGEISGDRLTLTGKGMPLVFERDI